MMHGKDATINDLQHLPGTCDNFVVQIDFMYTYSNISVQQFFGTRILRMPGMPSRLDVIFSNGKFWGSHGPRSYALQRALLWDLLKIG